MRIVMGLNEPQQRRIEVVLGLIEEKVFEFEAYLSGAVPNGEMIRVHNDLTEVEVEQLTQLLREVRQHIGEVRDQFRLRTQERDLRRMLVGHFAHFWAMLHDCRTDNLKGCGAVDACLRQTLDPRISQLIASMLKMERVIQGGKGK